ncbi:MAG: GNAT family N-acetyltransferase [Chloroflexi bacterium]|nr:GNAT family N-acetyltransferase [Chloroflexota bacterium]
MSRRVAERTGQGDGPHERPRVRELRDTEEILRYLEQDRAYAAAALGYLEPNLFAHSRWLVAQGKTVGLCLFGGGPSGGLVFTMGDPEAVAAILDAERGPLQAYVICKPEHLPTVQERYALWDRQDLMRMAVTPATFQPVAGAAVRLGANDVEALNRLYRGESGATFAAYHLRQGVYCGIWEDRRLVAVAGTQMISWTYGTAIVANVLTHPHYRGQGYATAVTGAVTATLLEHCREVVLNVDPSNTPAVRAYTRLGYRDAGRLSEAWGLRKQGGFWSPLVRWLERLFRR